MSEIISNESCLILLQYDLILKNIAACVTLMHVSTHTASLTGKVYAATRKSDGKNMALKFFGYTKAKPDINEINREIGLMIKLDRVQGVCQLVGIFNDTPAGLSK